MACFHSVLQPFNGKANPGMWLQQFKSLAARENRTAKMAEDFPLFLADIALQWYQTIPENQRKNFTEIETAFKDRFCPSDEVTFAQMQEFQNKKWEQTECFETYFDQMKSLGIHLKRSEMDVVLAVIQNLPDAIKTFILQKEPKTYKDLSSHVRLYHSLPNHGTDSSEQSNKLCALMKQLLDLQKSQLLAPAQSNPQLDSIQKSLQQLSHLQLPVQNPPLMESCQWNQPWSDRTYHQEAPGYSQWSAHHPQSPGPGSRHHPRNRRRQPTAHSGYSHPCDPSSQHQQPVHQCSRCLSFSHLEDTCPYHGQQCGKCSKWNHAPEACRTVPKPQNIA